MKRKLLLRREKVAEFSLDSVELNRLNLRQMKRNCRRRRSLALAISAAASVLFISRNAFAQEALAAPATSPAHPAAETAAVIVTGSNIPSANEVGPEPVDIITRDYIEQSGERTTEELLRDLPVANANGVPASNGATGFAPGASSISLRGFDPSATLVLIDGRRVAPYPRGVGDNGTVTFIDLNSIPVGAIGGIEILKDGASPIYGADAVAGVVNIKLRRDFTGAQTSIEYGNSTNKDNGEFAASLLFGLATPNGTSEVSGALTYYHRNAIFNHDRDYSAVTPSLSTNSSPGNFEVSRAAASAAAGRPITSVPANIATFFASPPELTNGEAPASDYNYTRGRSSVFNSALFSGSYPESDRYGGFLHGDHQLFGKQMVLYADLLYAHDEVRNELAPTPTGLFQAPGNVTIAIPPHAPGATLGGPTDADTGVSLDAYNPFNPFQQIISGNSRLRLAEFGNRIIEDNTDAVTPTLGIKGDHLFDGSWGYDAAVRYSQVQDTERGIFVSRSRFNRIVNAADPIFDPASPQFIGTTVPYNPFGDFRVPVSTNNATVDFATVHTTDFDRSQLATADFTVYTTSLVQLPAGGVALAFGGQFRWEDLSQKPDKLLVAGDILGTAATTLVSAERKSLGLYSEATLPIFSQANAIAGFHALDFVGSVRFENYFDNDTNIVVPKAGLRWQPFDDSFTFRATWGEGFREPSLFELHNSPREAFDPVVDPKTRQLVTDIPTLIRSNPNLSPEDSRNFSAGFVFTPKFVPRLNLAVDLFDIERQNPVAAPTTDAILAREAAGNLLPGEEVDRDANGNLTRVVGSYTNGGPQKARGVDLTATCNLPTPVGTFTWLTQATYLDSFRFAETPDDPQLELRRQPIGQLSSDAYLAWKGKSRLDWQWNGLDLNATAAYIDGFHELDGNDNVHWVRQTWTFDLQASYRINFDKPTTSLEPALDKDAKDAGRMPIAAANLPFWKTALNRTTITIGCNNITDRDPPVAFSITGYPDFIYDSVGRFIYVRLTKQF
jgi:iron complex outermembrane receptor protein